MKLNRTGSVWNRNERNKINDNWNKLEGNVNNLQNEITDKVFEEIKDSAKLNWGTPVNNFSELPSNSSEGDTRFTRDTGKVYRFDGKAWKEIQEIDASPVNEVDSRLSEQLAQKSTKTYLNIKDFGAIGDGLSHPLSERYDTLDEAQEKYPFATSLNDQIDYCVIQSVFIKAYMNKKSVYTPNGTYLSNKPIFVIGDSKTTGYGSSWNLVFEGESQRGVNFYFTDDYEVHEPGASNAMGFRAGFVVVNEEWITETGFTHGSVEGSSHFLKMTDFTVLGNNNIDFGVMWATTNAESTYKRIRVVNCVESSFKNLKAFYLNILEKLRGDNGKISFDFDLHYSTSLSLNNCYSMGATEKAYAISNGDYMTMLNCCSDWCKGTVFYLRNYKGVMVGCGSESYEAETMFHGLGNTNVVIDGAFTWGNQDLSSSVHVKADGSSRMIFNGGYILKDRTETGLISPGRLLSKSPDSLVKFNETKIGDYALGSKVDAWSDWLKMELLEGWNGDVKVRSSDSENASISIYVYGSNVTSGTIITNIPKAYRPHNTVIIPVVTDTNTFNQSFLVLTTSGNLIIPSGVSLSTGTYYLAEYSYIK